MTSSSQTVIQEVNHLSKEPILIIDKDGFVGVALYEKLQDQAHTILVSGKRPEQEKNCIYIPYIKNIPTIPDAKYSYIFFIWDGQKHTYEIVASCIKKAAIDNTKFIFVAPKYLLSEALIHHIVSLSNISFVVALGDLFTDIPVETLSPLQEALCTAAQKGGLMLSSLEDALFYPVFLPHALQVILTVAFGSDKTQKVFLVYPTQPLPNISLARLLQQVDPLLRVDFSKKSAQKETHHVFSGQFFLDDTIPTQEEIKRTYALLHAVYTQNPLVAPLMKSQAINRWWNVGRAKKEKGNGVRWRFISLLCMYAGMVLLSPIVCACLFLFLTDMFTLRAVSELKKNNITSSLRFAAVATECSFTAQKSMVIVHGFIGENTSISVFIDKNILQAQTTARLVGVAGEVISQVNQSFVSDKAYAQHVLAGVTALQSGFVLLDQMKQQGFIPDVLIQKLSPLTYVSEQLANTFVLLPDALGGREPKTYLILFQNNMELRPGGGFIGSYATVTLGGGKQPLAIHDVYDADGQLKGHVEPPFPLRRYMPIVHWYLRDSNFDVDVNKNASTAAFFLKEEMNQRVDGVIAVDLSFVKSLLKAVGSVYIPEYNQTVNEKNFFLLTEEHAEKNSFPGSSQKKDFLRAMFNGLQIKLEHLSGTSLLSVIEQIGVAVKNKHLLFSFADPTLQEILIANNISSGLTDMRPVALGGITDFLGINEANIGVNKTNYFVQRSVAQHVTIDERGAVQETATITYTNTSTGAWPGGEYKNYLRVIAPSGAVLTRIVIDGKEQQIIPAVTDFLLYEKKSFIAPKGLEVARTEEGGKVLYGFLVVVGINSTKKIEISYSLAQAVNMSAQPFIYDTIFFKQPGTDEYPFSFSLSLPPTFLLLHSTIPVLSQDNGVSFSKEVQTDEHFRIEMVKNKK